MPEQVGRRRRVSVVCTVLNEADAIDALLDSLEVQTRAPDEIVVVDGGSTDATWQRLERRRDGLPLLLLRRPGANISRGRNEAIYAASGEVIAVTDAGVRLERGWLAALLEPFERQEPPPDVVSGFFVADPRSLFELALGATTLPALSDVDPERFLPSSRSVAFLRSAWKAVGGYPEWLDYCEDLVFDLALKRAGQRFAWAPEAVAHFRPRADVRRFFLQYFRYARGDGKALLWGRRHAIRYATYLGTPALLYLTRVNDLALGLVALGILAYCRRPFQRLQSSLAQLPAGERLGGLMLIPVIRGVGDLAKMAGYPVGLTWRIQHRRELSCWRVAASATLRKAPAGSSAPQTNSLDGDSQDSQV